MNERFIPGKIDLTAIPNNSTLNVRGPGQGRGKYIFMPDGPGSGEIGQRPEEVNTASKIEKPQAGPPTPAAENPSDAKASANGLTEDAKRILHGADLGIRPKDVGEKMKQTLKENGISDEDINSKSFDELMEALRAKDVAVAGGAGGGEPPKEPPTETAAPGQPEEPEGEDKKDKKNRSSSGSRRGEIDQESAELLEKVFDFHSKLRDFETNRPQDLTERAALLAEQATLTKEFKAVIVDLPAINANGWLDPILRAASYLPEIREMLINQLIFKAYEDATETNEYRESLNLYSSANLDTLLGFMATLDPEKHQEFLGLKTAASKFHEMNKTLLGGDLQQFQGVAQGINYKHFDLMRNLQGVGDVMRLYEETFAEILARDKRITSKGYEDLKRIVERKFKAMNNGGIIKSEYTQIRTGQAEAGKMEEWEVQRALNVGRVFSSITLRSAEQIATGQIAEKGGKRYSSYPQESASRLMNFLLTNYRFQIASPRGGMEFLEHTMKRFKEFRIHLRKKLGINKVTEFGGMNTDFLEAAGMFGVSGVYSSWRLENMASPVIRVNIDEQSISLREWLDVNAEEISSLQKTKNSEGLYNLLRPVIDSSKIGLAVLLRNQAFAGEVGYKSRVAVWDRVAQENLPIMINYLTGIKTEGAAIKDIDSLRKEDSFDWDSSLQGETQNVHATAWEVLKEKIVLQHQKQVKQAAGFDMTGVADQVFTSDEQRLITSISTEAMKLPKHLADIEFPYTPFMNDIPFELLDYQEPGEEFFRRRAVGDLGAYNGALGAYTAIMNNPGGINHEQALEQFGKIIAGVESPQGTEDAQERIFPMFETWLDWVETKPGERQALFKGAKQALRKPTSIAQEYAGLDADSLDEFQTRKQMEHAHLTGILSHHLFEIMKKKKKLGNVSLLWAIIRDFFYVPFVSAGYQLGKRVGSEKG